jgi:Flp pilus assembly protein TadB
MIAEATSSIDLTSPTALLFAGITTVGAVVVILWRMVIARNTRCEEENKKMAENILILTEKVGTISGQHMVLAAMIRGCSVPGCVLKSQVDHP